MKKILLVLIMAFCGCRAREDPAARADAGPPPAVAPANLVRIQGSIALDGKPLAGGMVMFLPEDEEHGRPASGIIDPDGTFELGTVSPGDGVVPGKYRVVVTPQNRSGTKDVKAIPARYSDLEKTPLRSTVKVSDQRIHLDIHS
jgi:hypothetical protein